MRLEDVALVLGCSKAAASMVKNGKYDRPGSDLPERYAALVRLVDAVRGADRDAVLRQVCMECERQDCTGCRLADI
ncbi:hypothetical protein [Thiobacter aerophilum]|uniref:XRE family transcriptional regulator n=1 Tax=Thiobacter aerophilum TaxID=3121275 RepID=A0ABV0EDM6_9BURK